MHTFHSDPASMLWGSTSVSNAFLVEYMPSAPENYVKIYLYAFMYVHAGLPEENFLQQDIAKALSLDIEEVEKALRYWERCRIITRISDNPPKYRFISVQQTLLNKELLPQDSDYQAFAIAIYSLFGEKRKLHGGETVLAYEWVEDLKLPSEVVIMLIQHMIFTRGTNFSFKSAEKMALELCKQQVKTPEQAEIIFSRNQQTWKNAKKILTRFGKRRYPSEDELNLYDKWTNEWGFKFSGIEKACAETTKGDPSFAYLDKILYSIYTKSNGHAKDEKEVNMHLQQEQDETTAIKELFSAIGIKSPIIDNGKRTIYKQFLTNSSHEIIMLAANEIGKRRGSASLDSLDLLLTSWKNKGLTDISQVKDYLNEIKITNGKLEKLTDVLAKPIKLTQQNRNFLNNWENNYKQPLEVIYLAAAYARNVDKPMHYIDKLLFNWHSQNIHTTEEAINSHEKFTNGSKLTLPTSNIKTVREQQYSQRDYTNEEFDTLSNESLEEISQL